MKWLVNLGRFVLVTVGVIVITSLGIDATQYFEGSGSALSIFTQEALQSSCPVGMDEFSVESEAWCLDTYEAGVGPDCPVGQPRVVGETAENLNTVDCIPVSVKNQLPWTSVTYYQAEALCARVGKQLPDNQQWYLAALGTPDNPSVCSTNDKLRAAGVNDGCRSGAGMYDMVGNVWEWVTAEAKEGSYDGRRLPEDGYVLRADLAGVALETSPAAGQPTFNDDYFWGSTASTSVMMRGGYYDSGTDAGVFSVHSGIDPSFSGQAIGFRCAQKL